jgi:hypothetical protein
VDTVDTSTTFNGTRSIERAEALTFVILSAR